MGMQKSIHSFFKRKVDENSHTENQDPKRHKATATEPQPQEHEKQQEHVISEAPLSNVNEVDFNNLKRDPAKRKPMWDYPVNLRERVRRAYLNLGPFQISLTEYPGRGPKTNTRRFQYAWFSKYPNWLEYSPTTHSAYCFLCYVANNKPSVKNGYDAYTVKGFNNWRKVTGKDCVFLKHMGSSRHRNAVVLSQNLLNQAIDIENIILKQSEDQIVKNRIGLGASVDIVR